MNMTIIELLSNKRVQKKNYKCSPEYAEIMNEQINEMYEMGVIEHSSSQLVVHWIRVSISNGFRDIVPKHNVPISTMLNRHCACAISRDTYPYENFLGPKICKN